MNRRVLLALSSLLLVLLAPAANPVNAPAATTPSVVDYDLERVRAAMARGARSVAPPPAEVGAHLADKPRGWRHSTEPVSLEQPDGSSFQARGLEPEEGGGQATLDGYLVTHADDGWWHYGVRQDNGRIRSTGIRVGQGPAPAAAEADRMPAGFRSALAQFMKSSTRLEDFLASRAMAEAAAAAEAGEPVVFKIPAIMYEVNNDPEASGDVTADDFQSENTAEYFEQQLSGIGTSETGTVTEMYLEQSFGKMVIEIDVFGPYEGALSQIPCFFGTYGAPVTGDVAGLGGGGAKGMAVEAVALADRDGVDFSPYDNNGDGWVDFLTILHSGADAAATGDPCQVWSHYIGSIVGEPSHVTDEGLLVGPVLTIPEIDLQIGVTAHEIMHALGEPDYYGTAGTVGTGDWDLGAGGSWAGIPAQTNPVHFNPVMKMNFGWVQPRVISATSLNQALRPRASYPDLIQVPLRVAEAGSAEASLCDQAPVGIENQNNAFYTAEGSCLVEGFLIENVHQASARWNGCTFEPADFDRQLYGAGLMVWHWDFTNYESLGNNNVLRPMLDIEEFDRRDPRQELGTGLLRGQPLDLFWGDPVGISGATQLPPNLEDIPSPEGSPWTVTGLPAGLTPAEPQPEWVAPAAPEATAMIVELSWGLLTNDWNLYVDKWIDRDGSGAEEGQWVQVGASAAGLLASPTEQVMILDFAAGERFRARAENALSLEPEAELSVTYSSDPGVLFGPAGTRDAFHELTGWQFTNIRPNDYTGIAHSALLPRTPIVLDLVKHDDTTVDVSGDFLRRADRAVTPTVAGQPVVLETPVYNHGGKAVRGARFALYDRDPAAGGAALQTKTVDLDGFSRKAVQFTYTPRLGRTDLYVVASAPGDLVAGNNVVRTELTAYPGGGDVLIVDNDYGWTFEQDYQAVLNGLGVTHDVVEGEPPAAVLKRYDAVVWLTPTVSGAEGVLSSPAERAVAEYLDGGGKLWMASTRAAGYLTTRNPEWLTGYFGLTIEQNLLNSPGTVTGLGGPVGGTRAIELGYLDGKPYIDYGPVATEGVHGTATGLFAHEATPEGGEHVVATAVEGSADKAGFRTVYGLPIGLVLDPEERTTLMEEVLTFFGVPTRAPSASELAVRFNRFQLVQDGQPWPVTVGAVAPGGVSQVELVHRAYGTQTWRSLPLTSAGNGLFSGTIPAAQIPNNGLEYFVRVTSGGRVTDVDGGARLPNVASAPYGDPVRGDTCPAAVGGGAVTQPRAPVPAPAAGGALPATGLAYAASVGALLLTALLCGAALRRRRLGG